MEIHLRKVAIVPAALLLLTTACDPSTRDAAAATAPDRPHIAAATPVEAGAYLVRVGGCDDCHTPGFSQAGGNVPDSVRLIGQAAGFRGPWGTSYPMNLRRSVQALDAPKWIAMIRSRNGLPPMPWPALHAMDDRDLGAIHAYIRSLAPVGALAPTPLPPGVEPNTPYLNFEPVFPKSMRKQ